MSHTSRYSHPEGDETQISFIHNGDYTGEVTIKIIEEQEISPGAPEREDKGIKDVVVAEIVLPVDVLKSFVADLVRNERATQLENQTADEILGLT